MRFSQRDEAAHALVLLSFATDYLEVLATVRSTRLLSGRRCLIALVRKTAAARAGEPLYQDPGNVYIAILEERRSQPPKRVWEQLIGHGCNGKLTVRDLNRDGKEEIFFWVDGQACVAGVLQLVRSNQARWLYRSEGRFQAKVQDVNRNGLWEVVESWLTVQLDEPYYSQIASKQCLFARKVWRWERSVRAYRLWKVEPDRAIQKRLPRDALLRTPGAKEILGP
jgi:hypothetical protein